MKLNSMMKFGSSGIRRTIVRELGLGINMPKTILPRFMSDAVPDWAVGILVWSEFYGRQLWITEDAGLVVCRMKSIRSVEVAS